MPTTSTLRQSIDADGYVIVPNAVPRHLTDAVVADIWRHTGFDPNDPETWYDPKIISKAGMSEMYHYQSMWDVRQHSDLHEIFAAVYGSEKLWVSLDRVAFKPPADPRHPDHDFKGFIHWDTDIGNYPDIPFLVQGVLALADTDPSMGGFQCVPSVFRILDTWLPEQGEGLDRRRPDVTGHEIIKPHLNAGDLLIWHVLMPHGNGHNTSSQPRLGQYVTMYPAIAPDATTGVWGAADERVKAWRERNPPPSSAFPGDPRQIEQREAEPPSLTPLGRRLLGLDPWP